MPEIDDRLKQCLEENERIKRELTELRELVTRQWSENRDAYMILSRRVRALENVRKKEEGDGK